MRSSTEARYRFVRELGRGGMGAVDLVFDAVRGQEIARKRILHLSSAELLRHKDEFRTIAPLHHPNLVALYELDEDEVGPFFTMEAIDGVTLDARCARVRHLVRHVAAFDPSQTTLAAVSADGSAAASVLLPTEMQTVARESSCDFERLFAALRQILAALAFLHGEGIVHCDIKPSNILVRADGAVKLLDFGILAKMSPNREARLETSIGGTPAYLAPERIRGEWPTPAVDLYSLGVMLFELATGQLPFRGDTLTDVLRGHLEAPVPLASSVTTGVPVEIAEACRVLLQKTAGARPKLDALARMVFHAPLGDGAPSRRSTADLVGRQAIGAALRRRLDLARSGAFASVVLLGPTGAGKTSVLGWFAGQCGVEDVVVLRGGARSTERIAFNGIDGAIDDLARRTQGDPAFASCRAQAAAAFPVLGEPQPGASVTRGSAFAATIDAIARVALARGLVLAIDDAQWADSDSLAFLDALVEAAPPRVLLVVVARDDLGDSPALEWARRRLGLDPLYVGPLSSQATEEILHRAAGARALPVAESLIDACGGNPFLAELVGRALARGEAAPVDSIIGLLSRVVARTSELGRALLSAIVASGAPCRSDELRAIVERSAGEVDDALRRLEEEGLVRRFDTVGLSGRWGLRHDAVRVASLSALGDPPVKQAHAAFARLLASRDADTYRRVHHLVASGQREEGARLAPRAAIEAEGHLAFGFAAEMYAIALEAPGEERDALLRARAVALDRIGAYRDAAACWRDLARRATDPGAASDALLGEARSLLGASDIAAGYSRLDEALARRGEPRLGSSWLGGAVAALSYFAGPIRSAPARTRELTEGERSRIEGEVHTALLVAYFDPFAGLRLLQRAHRSFVSGGLAEGAAWCDYALSNLAQMGSAQSGPVPLAERYCKRADASIAGTEPKILEVATFPYLIETVRALRAGDCDAARVAADAGLAILEAKGTRGSHTHLFGLANRVGVEAARQNMFSFERELRRMRAAARDGAHVAVLLELRLSEAHLASRRGDFSEALRVLAEMEASWPKEIPIAQRGRLGAHATFYLVALGDVRGAREERERLLSVYPRFSTVGNMYAGQVASKWALCEVLALRAGVTGASARTVRSYAAIAERAPPLDTSVALRALAYLEEHHGDVPAALTLLLRADEEATRLRQPVDVAIARYQRGKRVGGDEGAMLMDSARALMTEAGAAEALFDEDGR